MAQIAPFAALRPTPDAVGRVASVPYDVVDIGRGRGAGRRQSAQLPARLAPRDRSARPARRSTATRSTNRRPATSIGCGAPRRWSSRIGAELLRLPPAHGRARADRRGRLLLGRRVRPRPDQEAREDAARQGRRPHAPHPGAARADRPGVPHLSRRRPRSTRWWPRVTAAAAALRLHRRRRRPAHGLAVPEAEAPALVAGLRGDPRALHRRRPPSRGQRLRARTWR